MSAGGPRHPDCFGDPDLAPSSGLQSLALHKEDVAISKRTRRRVVRAELTTTARDTVVDTDLCHERVVVERVAIGRVVDSVPPVRQEGDVTILSVVAETVVVERRLVLKEEVHLRRVKVTERHCETVSLREQSVVVSRTGIAD